MAAHAHDVEEGFALVPAQHHPLPLVQLHAQDLGRRVAADDLAVVPQLGGTQRVALGAEPGTDVVDDLLHHADQVLEEVEELLAGVVGAAHLHLEVLLVPVHVDDALKVATAVLGAVVPLVQVRVVRIVALLCDVAPQVHLYPWKQVLELSTRLEAGVEPDPAVHPVGVALGVALPQAVERLHEVETRELVLHVAVVVARRAQLQRFQHLQQVNGVRVGVNQLKLVHRKTTCHSCLYYLVVRN